MRPQNPPVSQTRKRRCRSLAALDALNFFQADVHGGVGPFLVTFLATGLHWTPDRIGTVMFASGIVGLCAQAPTGALVDKLEAKRLIVAVSAALIALACMAMVQAPSYPIILAGQSFIAVAGACFGPGIAAISIGLVQEPERRGKPQFTTIPAKKLTFGSSQNLSGTYVILFHKRRNRRFQNLGLTFRIRMVS